MSKVREVKTSNKGLFTTMGCFELRKRENGKTTLGTGSFGQIQGSNITTPYEQEGIEREIKVHLRSSHPNIVQLFDSFQENDAVYMVLEYVSNGNLYNHVQRRKRLEEKEACKYFMQTCQALQYLHKNNVFHRDIKPENLLLDSNLDIKLCDFGWCAENIHLKRKTFCGTYEYMAPEIVSDIAYDYTIDIWSVGVLLYEMIHGYAPFKGKEYKEISANIKQCQVKYSSQISAEAQELITRILQKDPTNRPSFNQIYQSNFVRKNFQLEEVGISLQSQLKIENVNSPRLSSGQINLQKYQSPLQKHQPKGRNEKSTIYLQTQSSPNQLGNTSKSKISLCHQPKQSMDKKNSIFQIDSRLVSEVKAITDKLDQKIDKLDSSVQVKVRSDLMRSADYQSCISEFKPQMKPCNDNLNIYSNESLKSPCLKISNEFKSSKNIPQKQFEDIRKKINFDNITPLKDYTLNFQNQHSQPNLTISTRQDLPQTQDENVIIIPSTRKKNPNSTSSFLYNTNQPSKLTQSKQGTEKKIQKSNIMSSQPQLFKSFKQTDIRKASFTNSLGIVKQCPVAKINIKSKFVSDENSIYSSDYKSKLVLNSTKTTARKETPSQLEVLKSLPCEQVLEQNYHIGESNVQAKSDRGQTMFAGLQSQNDSKTDYDKMLKVYMSLCQSRN